MKQSNKGEWLNKFIAWVYGRPGKTLKLVAVTGANASEVVALSAEVLKADGKPTAYLAAHDFEISGQKQHDEKPLKPSRGLYQRFLQAAKRAGAEYVVIELAPEAVARNFLGDERFAVTIVTDNSKVDKLLEATAVPVLNKDLELPERPNMISFGRHRNADARIDRVTPFKKGTEIQAMAQGRRTELASFLTTDSAPMSIAAALALGLGVGINLEKIADGIANLDS
ncbi:hypothetical protein FWH13_00595 [Candidatus Saccharibacteria bacterium]|nr:hypothetical protein [Candidatus Saccharibacteria bacterium]